MFTLNFAFLNYFFSLLLPSYFISFFASFFFFFFFAILLIFIIHIFMGLFFLQFFQFYYFSIYIFFLFSFFFFFFFFFLSCHFFSLVRFINRLQSMLMNRFDNCPFDAILNKVISNACFHPYQKKKKWNPQHHPIKIDCQFLWLPSEKKKAALQTASVSTRFHFHRKTTKVDVQTPKRTESGF